MSLRLEPEIVTWPEMHYVFLEAIGPFMETAPKTWHELHKLAPAISEHNQVTGYVTLYKIAPKIYRAGLSVAAAPTQLPEGVRYERFKGGKYSCFTLTGSYAQLPEASGRVWATVAEKKIPLRDDFNIENYVNDPRTTPEAELITQILVPMA